MYNLKGCITPTSPKGKGISNSPPNNTVAFGSSTPTNRSTSMDTKKKSTTARILRHNAGTMCQKEIGKNSSEDEIIFAADTFHPINHLTPASSSGDSSTLVSACGSNQSGAGQVVKVSTLSRRIASKIPVIAMSSRTLTVSLTASHLPAAPGMSHSLIQNRVPTTLTSADALQASITSHCHDSVKNTPATSGIPPSVTTNASIHSQNTISCQNKVITWVIFLSKCSWCTNTLIRR